MIMQEAVVAGRPADAQVDGVTDRRDWSTRTHEIGLTEARALIARFRQAHQASEHAAAFTRAGLGRLLAQAGCAGVRAYYATLPSGRQTLVLVGVDADGHDLDDGELAEFGWPCPPFCSTGSALDV